MSLPFIAEDSGLFTFHDHQTGNCQQDAGDHPW
jgi:hypothetical protein